MDKTTSATTDSPLFFILNKDTVDSRDVPVSRNRKLEIHMDGLARLPGLDAGNQTRMKSASTTHLSNPLRWASEQAVGRVNSDYWSSIAILKTGSAMLFSLCWVFILSILGPRAPENLGTKIVTRQTLGPAGFSEQTLYIMPDRRRMESVQRRNTDGAPEMQDELSSVFILRCDLGQSFLLRPKTEEYSSSPYPPKPMTPEQAAQLAVEKSGTSQPAQPTLRVETTTVDTGERKEMFGYVARHVITTRKQTPLDGSTSQPSQSVTDGWYIDLDRSISCDPKVSPGGKRLGFLSSRAVVGGKQVPLDRPEFVDIGARETGLPLKETRTVPTSTQFSDSSRKTYDSLNESEVTVLERVALDPALFVVPSGYKQVESSQRKVAE
jgi:hypothetical protein